jgi:hypothetical protein
MALLKTLEITLKGYRAERVEGRFWVRALLPSQYVLCPVPTGCPIPTHRCQTVSRALHIGGELVQIAAFTQSHPRGGPVPLGLLLMEPKELEMPLLMA